MVGIRKKIFHTATVIDKDINAPYYFEEESSVIDTEPEVCTPVKWSTPTMDYDLSGSFFSMGIAYASDGNTSGFINLLTDPVIEEPVTWQWRFEYSDGSVYEGNSSTSIGKTVTNAPEFYGNIVLTISARVGSCLYERTITLGGI